MNKLSPVYRADTRINTNIERLRGDDQIHER